MELAKLKKFNEGKNNNNQNIDKYIFHNFFSKFIK